MLFKSLAISALAGLVAADYASIVASLQLIDKDTLKLDTDVKAFNGNLIFSLPILGDDITLNQDLNNGTTTIQASAELSVNEAANLVGTVQKLSADVNVTVEDLIAKHDAFASLNLTGIVLVTLEGTKDAADKYSTALISKVPADLQSTAQNIAAPIEAAFDKAIAVYQK